MEFKSDLRFYFSPPFSTIFPLIPFLKWLLNKFFIFNVILYTFEAIYFFKFLFILILGRGTSNPFSKFTGKLLYPKKPNFYFKI